MAREDGFKLQVPKLKKETNFIEWRETLESALGTKHLKHFLYYDVQKPYFVELPTSADENPWTNIHNQLPKEVKDRKAQGTFSATYDENSVNLPDMLIDLAISSSLIVIVDEALFAIYTNSDDFKKARSDWVKNVEKVRIVVRSSIAYENVHLFKHPNVYRAFATVVSQFAKETKLERIDVKRRLSKLKCYDLKTYVNDFKRLLVELDHAGGDRNSEEILTMFVDNIPNSKYLTYKTMFPGTTIMDAFNYFKQIGERQANFKKSEQQSDRTYTKVRKVKQTSREVKLNQVISIKKVTVPRRCTKCGGFGHLVQECPTRVPVCHRCGSENHFKKDCKVKKIYVECTGEDEDENPTEVQRTDEEQDQTDDMDGIWDSDSSSVVLRTVRTSKSCSTSPCSCRFGTHCLQLVLDSGASQSITGSKELLVDQKPMSSTLVINAFGGHSVASLKGTLKVMLTNNVELVIPNVLYCKEVDGNILSVEHLVREGLTVHVDKSGAHLFKQARKIYSGTYQDGSYLMHATATYKPKEAVQALVTKVSPELTHARFGHASVPYLKRAGLPAVAGGFCMACSAGKQTRRHVKKQAS